MTKKSAIKMIGIFFLGLCLCLSIVIYLYYIFRVKADMHFCQQQLTQSAINQDFFNFIDTQSINASNPLLWKHIENRDEFIRLDFAKKIIQNPTLYLGDALKVVASPKYDENQKMHVIFLMKYLPIKHYMCVMDISNKAYEQGIIKNNILLKEAINPDPYRGKISYYWWLSDWQKFFNKHANQINSKEYVKDVLNGGQFYLFPPKA